MNSTNDRQLTVSTCKGMVTQVYTFNSWSKQKTLENGHGSSSGLPYVGFPGLSLTPIPESPLLDSMLTEDVADRGDRDRWLHPEVLDDSWSPKKNKSLPSRWLTNKAEQSSLFPEGKGDLETSKRPLTSGQTSNSCSVNVHVVQTTTFLPKEELMTRQEKRAHMCKLLLFALCGIIIVAGIVLWIFSPAFT